MIRDEKGKLYTNTGKKPSWLTDDMTITVTFFGGDVEITKAKYVDFNINHPAPITHWKLT